MEKIEFEAASFRKALAAVMPAVSSNSPLPILSHVRVRFAGLDASNLDMQITAPVNTSGEPIDICVQPDKLKAAADMARDKITLQVDAGRCIIVAGRHRFTVPYLAGADFPQIELADPAAEFDSTADMHEAIGCLAPFCADSKDVRYYLRGMRLECVDGLITATATNGGSLATMDIGQHIKPFALILPRAAADELAKGAPGRWGVSKFQVVYESDECRMVLKCIDGNYPDWRRILFKGQNSITLGCADMAEAAQLSRLMTTKDKNRPMRMLAKGDVLKVTSEDSTDSITTEVPICAQHGSPLDIGVDGKLLAPILKAVQEEEMTLEWNAGGALMTRSGGMTIILSPFRV